VVVQTKVIIFFKFILFDFEQIAGEFEVFNKCICVKPDNQQKRI